MKTYTDQLNALELSSIRIIRENQSSTGGYVASPNFAVYNYSWFRDGAFIAYAMSLVGENESARAFHNWAAKNINSRSAKISELIARNQQGIEIDPEEHLHCRYSIDGHESDEDWTNFQLDGFGTWLWAANEFRRTGENIDQPVFAAASALIPYLIEFWATPSFDWWEESFGEQHVSTIGCISAGLLAIQDWPEISPELRASALTTATEIREFVMKSGAVNQHLTKWIGTDSVDGSLAALIAPLNWITDPRIAKGTLNEISKQLGVLGTHRHVTDGYFGGGPWPLLSVFLALGKASVGETEKAAITLEWLVQCANESLELPEQLPVDLLHPEERPGWIEKWGQPAQPLLWSHAMFLILKKKVEEINA
jgi:GH15 family glucan-1,4-alpha-glucosidase